MRTFKLTLLFLLALFMITGCIKKKEQQILDLHAKNAQLSAEFSKKDSLFNEFYDRYGSELKESFELEKIVLMEFLESLNK